MPDTALHIDSIVVDSIAADSIILSSEGETLGGIVLVNPDSGYGQDPGVTTEPGRGMSWIYLIITVLFCIIGVKCKGNAGYMKSLITDLTDTRVRHNVFDDTVKETSLIILLNVMWACCVGILLWIGVRDSFGNVYKPTYFVELGEATGIAVCAAVAACYLLAMLLAYWVVGNVFSESRETALWVRGASASTGLQAFLLCPIALVALNYDAWSGTLVIMALVIFILGKIIFFYQGFRIFFAQISSWLLFLYYLCSLEIIPVLLTIYATFGILSGGI